MYKQCWVEGGWALLSNDGVQPEFFHGLGRKCTLRCQRRKLIAKCQEWPHVDRVVGFGGFLKVLFIIAS